MNPLTLIGLVALVAISSAQMLSPPVAPYFGPFGPIMPGLMMAGALGPGLTMLGSLGGLGGLGGIGGRFGLLGGPFGLGFGLGSFGPGGIARLGGIRGRRALDDKVHGKKDDHENVKCVLTRELLNCTGPHEIIQCNVEAFAKLPLELGHFKLNDFMIREKIVNKVETLKILPKKSSHRMGHKLEHLAIFDNEEIARKESGFYVKDQACFSDLLALVKEIPDKIKLTFNEQIIAS